MTAVADLIEALPYPAACVGADGTVRSGNAAFAAAKAPGVVALAPGGRIETHVAGQSWIWRAVALRDGDRLVSAEPAGAGSATSRERYLAALSHELRTPLNGVLGMSGLLGRTRLDADQRAYVTALKESGEHLLGLVNDVLDLAKLESGQIDLEPHPVDAERVLQGVAELLSPRAHEKGLEIAWTAQPGLPRIHADEGRLKQILFNLAGNALKFTETGGALLSVSAQPAPGGLRLRFSVCDTGPGVPETDQARVFEEFARLEGPQQRLEGAGLGLAIVRRLAEAHGGSVGLANRPGGGADFWFEAVFEAEAATAAEAPLEGLTVAVVSASAVVGEAAARQVEACGGTVVWFGSLAGAAAAPDGAVLLVDHALRGAARSFKPPAGRAAIVLLAPEERARIPRCRDAGFAGYLIKPLRRASLAERVLAAAGRAAGRPAETAAEDDRIAPSAGQGLRVLLAEDNPINALLARSLLEREGCTVDRAANGSEAVEAASVAGYDLILMDVRMPVMDGLEAAAALRARGVSTPIVALTADTFADDRKACIAAGMDDFLSKPLDPAALRAALARWAGTAQAAPGFTASKGEAKLAS